MQPLSVIIADDHAIFRNGLQLSLNEIPEISEIRHAENGSQVIELMELQKADVIFMDLKMPVIDGIETTALVRKKYPGTKIIAVSSMDDHENIINMFKAGAGAYLFKNTNLQEIENALNVVMRGDKYYTNEISTMMVEKMFETEKPDKPSKIKAELTSRETEVLKLICQQYSYKEIAEILEINDKTVQNHRMNILSKTNCKNTVGLVLFALENKIIFPS